jgi:hypothetical protein
MVPLKGTATWSTLRPLFVRRNFSGGRGAQKWMYRIYCTCFLRHYRTTCNGVDNTERSVRSCTTYAPLLKPETSSSACTPRKAC